MLGKKTQILQLAQGWYSGAICRIWVFFPHIFLHIFLTFMHFFGKFAMFFVEFADFFVEFTHFFVDFCRNRHLRDSSKIFKILASRLFSSPCLSQILNSTPVFTSLAVFFSGTAGTMLIVRTSRGTSAQKGSAMEEVRSGD